MERLYTNTVGPDSQAEKQATEWLVQYAMDHKTGRAALVIPSVTSGENLSRIIGEVEGSRLVSNREVQVGSVMLELFTLRTLPPSDYPGPIVTLWCARREVEEVEHRNPPALCAVQWVEGDLGQWAHTWGAVDLITGASALSDDAPPVVRGAVTAMSRSGDVVHSLDKRSSVRVLKSMRLAGVDLDPEAIRVEALRQGWSPPGADRLRKLATKVADGRRVQGGGKVSMKEAKAAVARWEEAGAECLPADLGGRRFG